MKKFVYFSLVFSLILAIGYGTALAGNGAPSGAHHNVNIIGHPKGNDLTDDGVLGGNGAGSGGAALFIPLRTSKRPSIKDTFCTADDGVQTVFEDEIGPDFKTSEPTGKTRIYFTPGDKFEIVDRDATDGSGEIIIPVDPNSDNEVLVDLWVRVLGKPGGCAEILGYAFEDASNGGQNPLNLWWYSGTIKLDRETGKSVFIKATDIFEVDYCLVEPDGAGGWQCEAGTETSLSVFDDIFSEYFWEVNNYDTRLIQMRFYVREASI
jgi:hypothetical protein